MNSNRIALFIHRKKKILFFVKLQSIPIMIGNQVINTIHFFLPNQSEKSFKIPLKYKEERKRKIVIGEFLVGTTCIS